jgi:hypothetical protein
MRGIDGGLLVQEGDFSPDDESAWKVVTKRAPTGDERAAMSFANRVVRGVVRAHVAAKKALLDEGREFSELVDELVRQWTKTSRSSDF